MSHSRRGICVTLVTAALTALMATVVAPSAFALSATLTVTPLNSYVASGANDVLTVTGAGLMAGALVTLAPSSGTVSSTLTADLTGTVSGTVTFTEANLGSTPLSVTFGATDTASDAFTYLSPIVYVSRAAGALGPSGFLEVYPATVAADGSSVATITVNPFGKAVGSTSSSLSLTANVGAFTGVPTDTVWTSPTFAAQSVSGTVASATGSATVTLRAPTAASAATVQLSDNGSLIDTVTVTFSASTLGGGGNGGGIGFGARKVAFYAGAVSSTCAAAGATPATGAQRYGFAIFTTTGHNRMNVTVSLKGADPNTTYKVWVELSPVSCTATPFTIRTNSHGNGNGHKHLTLGSGAKQAWVTAVDTASTSAVSAVLVTTVATVPVKAHGRGNGNGNNDNNGNKSDNGRGHGND